MRADLAARLGAEAIRIPPLRERVEDLGALAASSSAALAKPIELAAFQALCLYAWPGNVRELGKVVTSAEALARGAERIGIEHLPGRSLASPGASERRRRPRQSRPPPTPRSSRH